MMAILDNDFPIEHLGESGLARAEESALQKPARTLQNKYFSPLHGDSNTHIRTDTLSATIRY